MKLNQIKYTIPYPRFIGMAEVHLFLATELVI
jgi:hypothetical protein